MLACSRKRRPSSVDSRPAKKSEREASPVERRPTGRKPDGCLLKENRPSPRKSPRKATGLPLKPAVATSSFYGPKKSVYLTPLERKAAKESLPPPPPLPPGKAKSAERKNEKVAKRKQAKGAAAGSKIRRNAGAAKTVNLPKLNSSRNAQDKASEPKMAITITLNSTKKPKAKIFVGAAFFSAPKKPSSAHRKAATAKVKRPAGVKTDESRSHRADAPPKRTQTRAVRPAAKKDPPGGKLDCTSDLPEKTPRSPQAVVKDYRITKELKIHLTRTQIPTSGASSFGSQDDSSKMVIDVCDASSRSATASESAPPKTSTAVYPIFGSTSKGSKSAPAGPTLPLSSTKERPVRKRKEKHDRDQLIIDAGQKQFGAASCASCGMVYSADNPEDNFQHEQFHRCLLNSIKFVGWKKERVMAEFWDGKIIMVLPDDPKYAVKKADEVRRIADSELGFQQVALSRPSQAKTYLFVNRGRMVVGCLVAESIQQAFRVLEQPDQPKDLTKDDFMDRHRAWCCSTVPEKALCGLSRVWVFSLARRQGIARRMLDTVRSTFMYGSHLTKEEIAFSDPTPDGKQFATAYCGTPAFLVYNFVA
ncbi:N-acetyltransferase ESCO2 [Syngnathoides biaculeatus]|uniref:N-acetyltransferase ESCO2 n=1 Tax=Syngnathoides biaculeatus TaxID=300417 RepID=UPI002ADE2324|nr:N-acetyltransferase ESCO2 [Syngnathoides biaculeatus]XP_061668240.1 N-acetyltransferase ESCO2 [Syngnathoides biaculeatus]